MTEVENEQAFSKYLKEWVNSHYSEWYDFYHDVRCNRRSGIYLLKDGTSLMELLNSIMGNLEDKFSLLDDDSHLIPSRFASVSHLIGSLKWFKGYVDSFKPILDNNIKGKAIDNYIVAGIYNMVVEIDQMVDRCVKVYGDGGIRRPYQILREKLFNKDMDGFVESVNGVLKGVPYLSRKKKFDEGHFQTMIQILLIVLGFEPIVEQTLSDGRIDMVIKLDSLTYIIEFKYTDGGKSHACKALQQIKDNGYADTYRLTAQEIIGVGISFSGITKCINGMVTETLYKAE